MTGRGRRFVRVRLHGRGGMCDTPAAVPRSPAAAVPAVLDRPPDPSETAPEDRPAEGRPARGFRVRRRWVLAAAGLCVAGGAIAVADAVKYDFFAKKFGVVEEPGTGAGGALYRSGQISRAMFRPTIKKHGIDRVICLMGNDTTNPDHVSEVAVVDALPNVRFSRFPLRGDGTGDFGTYKNALAELTIARRAGRTVLVHCSAGAQRTGSIVAAYRLLVKRDDPADVYAELGRYGWEPDDAAMLDYLNAHLAECAEMLHDRGLIAEVPNPVPVLGP